MTDLARLIAERRTTYTAVAGEARLQPRTVRQIATGETPIDNVSVGTVRRLAAALRVPAASLIDPGAPLPGDSSLPRGARLSAAVRDLMWAGAQVAYPSPVERADELASTPPSDFFADMPPTHADRA